MTTTETSFLVDDSQIIDTLWSYCSQHHCSLECHPWCQQMLSVPVLKRMIFEILDNLISIVEEVFSVFIFGHFQLLFKWSKHYSIPYYIKYNFVFLLVIRSLTALYRWCDSRNKYLCWQSQFSAERKMRRSCQLRRERASEWVSSNSGDPGPDIWRWLLRSLDTASEDSGQLPSDTYHIPSRAPCTLLHTWSCTHICSVHSSYIT